MKKNSSKKRPIRKKPIRKKPIRKKPIRKKPIRKKPIRKKPIRKKPIRRKPIRKKPISKKLVIKKKENLVVKIIQLQNFLKPNFKIKISFSLEKYIQSFFDKIENIILNYKILKLEDKRKKKAGRN